MDLVRFSSAPLQDTPSLGGAYLWLAVVVLLLLAAGAAFTFVLLRRHRDWLGERLDRFDAVLAARAPRPWRFIRQRFSRNAWHGLALTGALALVVVMITLFAAITESWVSQGALYHIDQSVNQALHGLLPGRAVEALAVFTNLGGFPVGLTLSLGLAVLLLVRKAWWRLLALLLVMGGGTGLMWALKWFFGRTRPEGLLATPASASFPSGHTFTAVALYGFLLFLVWQRTMSAPLRRALTAVLVLVMLGIGLSRVLLSVHWVSDVLGGFALGLAWLVFALVFVRALHAHAAPPPRP